MPTLSPQIARLSFLLYVGALLCCGPDPYTLALRAEFDAFRKRTREEIDGMKKTHDDDTKRLWSRVRCDNEQVRDFIRRCEGPGSLGCSDQANASAVAFMNTQHYVVMYLRSQDGIFGLIPMRRGQILDTIESHNLFPTTRFLILVQPRGDGSKFLQEADTVGHQLRQLLYTMGLPPGWPLYGPHVLPCKLKAAAINSYNRQIDHVQPGEPLEGQPRLRVWLFRTDCSD